MTKTNKIDRDDMRSKSKHGVGRLPQDGQDARSA